MKEDEDLLMETKGKLTRPARTRFLYRFRISHDLLIVLWALPSSNRDFRSGLGTLRRWVRSWISSAHTGSLHHLGRSPRPSPCQTPRKTNSSRRILTWPMFFAALACEELLQSTAEEQGMFQWFVKFARMRREPRSDLTDMSGHLVSSSFPIKQPKNV